MTRVGKSTERGDFMRYLTNLVWEKGEFREENQDALVLHCALTGKGRVLLAAVCDGMGGHSCGAKASALVTRQLQEWFYDTLLRAVQRGKRLWVIQRSLDRLIFQIQTCMIRQGEMEGLSMGTTMSVLVLMERKYLLWHLGDSRIYRFDSLAGGRIGKKPRVLTRDHRAGDFALTKCVGSFGEFCPEHQCGMVRKGEAFCICSDGFYRSLEEAELGEVLSPAQISTEDQIGRRLREAARCCRKRGEKDNLSVVYVKVQE